MVQRDGVVLHDALPAGQLDVAAARLPSMRPVDGPWLRCDAAYGEQMRLRRKLLGERTADVYAQLPDHIAAACGFLELVINALPEGFRVDGGQVICPDGARVTLDWEAPLWTVGHILQQDVCILEKQGSEHVLTAAVLCFPASWTLAEKIGKPLGRIHDPVSEYSAQIAARVQRMFDGVQMDRPMWRANALRYDDPTLFQPRSEGDTRPIAKAGARYIRSERQTVLRLPRDGAVAFTIHTMVVEAALK